MPQISDFLQLRAQIAKGVITPPLSEKHEPPPVDESQGTGSKPCHPRAIHNKYQPIGTRPGEDRTLSLHGKKST